MKTKFNPADRYLIGRWKDALEFESGMESVRKVYKEIIDEIPTEIQNASWWDNNTFKCWSRASGTGYIGFGKKSWDPTQSVDDFPGLWIAGIGLDHLLNDEADLPEAYLWIRPIKKGGYDRAIVRDKILAAAAPVLQKFPNRETAYEDDAVIVDYTFPQDRKSLIEKILNDGGRPFVDVLMEHVNRLALLIPAVDDALRKSGAKVTQK